MKAGYAFVPQHDTLYPGVLCSHRHRLTSHHTSEKWLSRRLWFPLAPAVFALAAFPSCWALGLTFLILAIWAFSRRGIQMGPHGINNSMKIDIGINKSREVLECLGRGRGR